MSASVFLCRSEELTEGRYREFNIEAGGETIFLVATRFQGRPRVWYNVCPHQGRALNFAPDRFITDDQGRLVCCAHGAVFEPDEGLCVAGPCRKAQLKGIEADERDEKLFIRAVD